MIPPQSARELTGAIWGQELTSVLKQCQATITNSSSNQPSQKLTSFILVTKSALCDVWIESSADVFDPGYVLSPKKSFHTLDLPLAPSRRQHA